MVLLELVKGRKGPGDVLVLVTSYREPLSFAAWLFIGKCYLDSEASYYPISQGYIGKAMLLNALNEIAHDVPFEKVIKHYKLDRKSKKLNIFDRTRHVSPAIGGGKTVQESNKVLEFSITKRMENLEQKD